MPAVNRTWGTAPHHTRGVAPHHTPSSKKAQLNSGRGRQECISSDNILSLAPVRAHPSTRPASENLTLRAAAQHSSSSTHARNRTHTHTQTSKTHRTHSSEREHKGAEIEGAAQRPPREARRKKKPTHSSALRGGIRKRPTHSSAALRPVTNHRRNTPTRRRAAMRRARHTCTALYIMLPAAASSLSSAGEIFSSSYPLPSVSLSFVSWYCFSDGRCPTEMYVSPSHSSSSPYIALSLSRSSALLASSRIARRGRLARSRPNASRCCSPSESIAAQSRFASSPLLAPSETRLARSGRRTLRKISSSSASVKSACLVSVLGYKSCSLSVPSVQYGL
mmetsp:Transcript_36847/g.90655  ORF Transcript_36847/g.90655 Transcript_36847/m.90655 type:complete len:335 (-) Transcript_36847:362-1366(-)